MDVQQRLQTALMPHLDHIMTPALVIDLDAVQHNVRAMIGRVGDASRWRPHVKTVKQSVVLQIILHEGVRTFKCATTDELELVLQTAATAGLASVEVWVAYPLMGATLVRAHDLGRRFPETRVQLLADRPVHLDDLAQAADTSRGPCPVFLDVNLGMNRTGSRARTWADAAARVRTRTDIVVDGLHGYDGHHAWDARTTAHAGYDELIALAELYEAPQISTSGTHSYGHALSHPGLSGGPWHHQISAGTVVLSDLRSAPAADDVGLQQAAFVISRVVSHPAEDVLTLDAGSKSIAPDRPAPGLSVVGHPELTPLPRSEEHLPVRVKGPTSLGLGDTVFLIPEHVCTTVNLYREALWLRNSTLAGVGPVEAMGRRSWLESAAQ